MDRSHLTRLALLAGLAAACGSPVETSRPVPAPGELAITTTTNVTDLGLPTGYWISVDGDSVQAIGGNGNTTIRDVPPGTHTIVLNGVDANCSVAGTNPRLATVASGETSSVEFVVTCAWAAVRQLAFVRDGQIYLINSDGTGLVQLTHTGENDAPAWSPDGQRLAFASNGGGSSDIYVMNADGSNVVRRTMGCDCSEPSWSPDGRTLGFTHFKDDWDEGGIFLIDADGGPESRVLLDSPGYDRNPAWSPDGAQIAFSSNWRFLEPFPPYSLPFYDLWVMNADASGIRPLLEVRPGFPRITHYEPTWSPDGQQIAVTAFLLDANGARAEIAVVNADGSGLKVIAQTGSYGYPAWSPDGRTIAFGSDCPDCQPSIRFVLPDGGAEGLIVANGNKPAWRP